MNKKKIEDVRETALKLDKIKSCCPDEFYYIKGWIHCLLSKEGVGIQMVTKTVLEEKLSK
jgi:hypothetical protein